MTDTHDPLTELVLRRRHEAAEEDRFAAAVRKDMVTFRTIGKHDGLTAVASIDWRGESIGSLVLTTATSRPKLFVYDRSDVELGWSYVFFEAMHFVHELRPGQLFTNWNTFVEFLEGAGVKPEDMLPQEDHND